MKTCSRCKIPKEESEFRMRYDKRGKGSRKLTYLNNTCRQCDSEITNKNYFAHKDDTDFIEKWRNKSNEYYHAHREAVKEKMRLRRLSPEYKEMMREYRKRNKEKIYQQEQITKTRYHEKNKDAITDRYAYNLLRTQGLVTVPLEEVPEELLEIKKAEVALSRLKQSLIKTNNNGNKSNKHSDIKN